MQIKYEEKSPYYEGVPLGFSRATIDDFYLKGHLIMDKPYLLHSFLNIDRYWAKRTKPDFINHNDFLIFLELGRVYVIK